MGKSLDEIRSLYSPSRIEERERALAAAIRRERLEHLASKYMDSRCPVCEQPQHFMMGSTHCDFQPSRTAMDIGDTARRAKRIAIEAAEYADAPADKPAHRRARVHVPPAQAAMMPGRSTGVDGPCVCCGAIGGHAAGCPEETVTEAAERGDAVAAAVEAARRHSGRFTPLEHPSTGKADAIIHFGRHSGAKVSDLSLNPDGAGYLRWILRQEFSEKLKAIIRLYV